MSDSTQIMYVYREHAINAKVLVRRLELIIKEYVKKSKCLYANWLAKDLGINTTDFTLFLIQHSHIFNTEVGKKSNQLIIKSMNANTLFFGQVYRKVIDGKNEQKINRYAQPLMFVPDSDSKLVICKVWNENCTPLYTTETVSEFLEF